MRTLLDVLSGINPHKHRRLMLADVKRFDFLAMTVHGAIVAHNARYNGYSNAYEDYRVRTLLRWRASAFRYYTDTTRVQAPVSGVARTYAPYTSGYETISGNFITGIVKVHDQRSAYRWYTTAIRNRNTIVPIQWQYWSNYTRTGL